MRKLGTLLFTFMLLLGITVVMFLNASAAGTSIASASSITMGTTYSDSITETNREDYYKFTLSSSGRIDISFTSYMEYYCVYVYNEDGQQIWCTESNVWISTTGMRKDNHTIDLEGGVYYLKITSDWYDGWGRHDASTGNYSFNIKFTESGANVTEPNNNVSEAKSILFNKDIKGQIAINDREDYYKFNIVSSIKINISFCSYMPYYCIYVYNENGVQVWCTESNVWDTNMKKRADTHTIDLENGTYYLKVTSDWYDGWGRHDTSTGNYTLNVKEYVFVPAVTNIKSTVKTNSIILKWDNNAVATGYEVYKYDSSSKKYVKAATTSATKCKISKLKSGTKYKFKVRAYIVKNGATYYSDFSDVYTVGTKPAKTTLKTVKSTKTGQAVVTWKTVTGANGYQIKYSTSKKFTGKTTKKATVKKAKTKKITLKKLKSGKKYFVKIRAYKTVNGKKIYGAYSKVKTVKVR